MFPPPTGYGAGCALIVSCLSDQAAAGRFHLLIEEVLVFPSRHVVFLDSPVTPGNDNFIFGDLRA